MRKSVYGIGFLCAAVLLCAGFYGCYRLGENRGNLATYSDAKAEGSVSDRESVIEGDYGEETVKTNAKITTSYILCAEDGKVVVYCEDGQTIYEYTDIPLSQLPSFLRTEIEAGKIVASTAELYSFLENYSS